MVAPMPSSKSRFALGKVVMTPGAIDALSKSRQHPAEFLARHQHGDWGDLDASDKQANDAACQHEGDVDKQDRILSAYKTAKGKKLWIITEADRSSTCLLLPEEY